MAAIITALARGYVYFNDEVSDPRTRDWFLMKAPWSILAFTASYIYFVQTLGPRWMANKKPYNLDRIMQIYNVVQIGLSAYLFWQSLALGWFRHYNFTCEPVDYSIEPRQVAIAWTVWLFLLVKIIDCLDTIFFVLRKKQNQVTFLHVYHHSGMILGTWIAVKYLAGGHITFMGFINSFVHLVMYSYYLLTSLKLGKLWWKKYLTQLQLAQFIAILYHFSQLLWVPDCGFPLWPIAILIPQNIFMIVLFADFYYKTYIKKRPEKISTENSKGDVTKETKVQ
ncbi:elongation of very long chain fatty acids protein AAEL008004-like [Venturia canescens]|uniref:elongation of very long chain fatty acids protein AAEL008004-like n=1 Tax=Venturia canescens TaxID=32260 RepID=UPI001C9D3FB8|nr:elongation of very long chain fatty acids protein AAEL008004-like [Venturia canescens]